MGSLSLTHDLTLRIKSPLLSKEGSTSKSEYSSLPSNNDGSQWKVTLTRMADVISVSTVWIRGSSSRRPEGDNYKKLFIIPYKKPRVAIVVVDAVGLIDGIAVNGTVDIKQVLYDKKLQFDIIVSTSCTMPESLLAVAETNKDIAACRQTMEILLKDTSSIDTCFVFPDDKAGANIGLGAHRCILSQHGRFGEMVQKAVKDMTLFNLYKIDKDDKVCKDSKGDKGDKGDRDDDKTAASSVNGAGALEPEVVVIEVDNFTFATFCALLFYVYTGEIKLSNDGSQFATCGIVSSPTTYGNCGNTRSPINWNPLDVESPWKLKDVEWGDLLIAADYYGITGLREYCQEEVSEAINESNVIKILFKVGTQSNEIKQEALNFIASNMESLFLNDKDSDPFLPYRDHPSYHELLIELIRIKAKTK